jgi:hypothetical protein
MKTPINFLFTCILIFVIGCTNMNKNNKESNNQNQQIIVDTLVIQETYFEDINVIVEQSSYPQIKGLSDSVFLENLNNSLKENITAYIDSTKRAYGSSPVSQASIAENPLELSPASVFSHFEVFYNSKNSIISIIQYFWRHNVGTGTAHDQYFKITNVDSKNNKYFEMPIKEINNVDTNLIVKQYKNYFKKNNSTKDMNIDEIEGWIELPILTKPSDFDKYSYLIKNDSICIVFSSNRGVYLDGDYIIPLINYHN